MSRPRAPEAWGTRGERGSGTLLVVGVMAVVGVVAAVAMVAAAYLVAGHQARGAADLAALSGAAAYAEGRAPCPAAARLAKANGGRLASCDRVGDDVDYVVSVEVVVDVGVRVPGLPRHLEGRAHAGPVR
ncbi:Rv3654c family TadE-like protein [Microlunatus flavus]|uniref:Helicase/secretion neighborhood TadE-like protein n=1 Tax=Microlunatus flavus TaxID=1036181 RepID=A0A1H8ZI67_9ACTN|nr:Rv3654c family TadE-like protein [Microlunatus flavus]SEP64126.1 helicase/secretion neighborhood TadE-like protein [Microlunatus flavus]